MHGEVQELAKKATSAMEALQRFEGQLLLLFTGRLVSQAHPGVAGQLIASLPQSLDQGSLGLGRRQQAKLSATGEPIPRPTIGLKTLGKGIGSGRPPSLEVSARDNQVVIVELTDGRFLSLRKPNSRLARQWRLTAATRGQQGEEPNGTGRDPIQE